MELAPEVDRLMRERPAQQVWLMTCGPGRVTGFDDLARCAGLAPLGEAWVEVDAARARRVLVALLHRDLAYGIEVMPLQRAEWLAAEFVVCFGARDVRFATNSADLPRSSAVAWDPATEFTFDAGVAAFGDGGAGIFWVADED